MCEIHGRMIGVQERWALLHCWYIQVSHGLLGLRGEMVAGLQTPCQSLLCYLDHESSHLESSNDTGTAVYPHGKPVTVIIPHMLLGEVLI